MSDDSLLDSIMDEASGFLLVQPSRLLPPVWLRVPPRRSPLVLAPSRVMGVSKDLAALKGPVSTAKTYSVVSVCASDSDVFVDGNHE